MRSAVRIIQGEHASLAAVLLALRRYVGPLRDHKVKPDCEVFATILSYIDTFANRFHHPKEDEYLFRALRERTRQADSVLLELQHEHATGQDELRDLKRALERTRGGDASDIEEFALVLDCFVKSQEDHLRTEEEILIPMAQSILSAADWEPIDKAFRANRDPLFGGGANGSISKLVARAFPSA